MTITSQAENNFIYDKLFATGGVSGTAWLGATRTENTAGGYDAATWTHGADHDSWEWVCGPEAGQKFFTRKILPVLLFPAGMQTGIAVNQMLHTKHIWCRKMCTILRNIKSINSQIQIQMERFNRCRRPKQK